MNINTTAGVPIDITFVENYFRSLVNHFFKILPMRENNESTLQQYIQSLQLELLGCKNLILAIDGDPNFITLLSILQFLIDNPKYETSKVKREVFKAISICNKLSSKFISQEVL